VQKVLEESRNLGSKNLFRSLRSQNCTSIKPAEMKTYLNYTYTHLTVFYALWSRVTMLFHKPHGYVSASKRRYVSVVTILLRLQ